MAENKLKTIVFILFLVEVLSFPIDNRIYNPDEMQELKKAGKGKDRYLRVLAYRGMLALVIYQKIKKFWKAF